MIIGFATNSDWIGTQYIVARDGAVKPKSGGGGLWR
jgi:hypothetical protein